MKAKTYRKMQERKAAKQQIKELFSRAYEVRHTNPSQAHLCVKKAYKLALKKRIKLTKQNKRRFCKHCLHYFIPTKNYRVRSTGKTITYTCLDCGKWQRFGYKKK